MSNSVGMRNGKYILVKAPKGYTGKLYRGKYVYEHTAVWWKKKSEVISPDEIIHHINGDTTDNRISNLCKMTRSEHSSHHGLEKPAALELLTCTQCSKEFKRLTRDIKMKTKLGQKNFYCSRSCQVKYQHVMKNNKEVESCLTRKF